MKKAHIALLAGLFLTVLSCSRPSGNDDAPIIYWSSPQNISNGTEVTLGGVNFGTDPAVIIVRVDSLAIAPTTVLSPAELKFIMPAGIVTSGSKTVRVSLLVKGKPSNVIELVVTYEHHGWKYIAEDAPFGCNNYGSNMYFLNDRTGYLFSPNCAKWTSDSGKNWGDVIMGYFHNGVFSVYNDRYFWIQSDNGAGNKDMLWWDYGSGMSGTFAYFDTLSTIPGLQNKTISGMYQTGQHSGYIITEEGRIFKLNNGYGPANITMEYEASYSATATGFNPYTNSLTVIDANNLMFAANPKINGVLVPIIVHKKNGVYTEYNLAALFGSTVVSVQMVDATTAYANDLANGRMYKYHNGTWSQLPVFAWVSVFHFVNKDVGYAAPLRVITPNYSKIFKTTDGGQTWTVDIDIRGIEPYVTTFFGKGNKIWVTGRYNTAPSANSFLLTYTP